MGLVRKISGWAEFIVRSTNEKQPKNFIRSIFSNEKQILHSRESKHERASVAQKTAQRSPSCGRCWSTSRKSTIDNKQYTIMNDDASIEEEAIAAVFVMEKAILVMQNKKKKQQIDGRMLPWNQKRQFRHSEALHCIQRDYMGIPGDPSTPLFNGKEFDTMFRISRSRFQRMMEDIGKQEDPFYLCTKDCFGNEVASFEARLLLPLKCIAFGVPPKCFRDYF